MICTLLGGCFSYHSPVLATVTASISAIPSGQQTPFVTPLPVVTNTLVTAKNPPLAPSGLPPTWTPLPTYSSNQARQVTMNLYSTSACKLPCLWGIIPGETSWLEAWQFLGRFATNHLPSDTLLLESKEHRGYIHFQVYLDFPQTFEEKYHLTSNGPLFTISIKTFTVDYIDLNTGSIELYMLPNILANYGKPEKIYVLGGETQIASGIELLLYYPNNGFISTQYIDLDPSVWNESEFNICFQNTTSTLVLWSQKEHMDFYDRLRISGVDQGTINLIKPIEQVSNFNVNTFYQAGTNGQPPCIEFKTLSLESP